MHVGIYLQSTGRMANRSYSMAPWKTNDLQRKFNLHYGNAIEHKEAAISTSILPYKMCIWIL